ncbi:MAG TPA: uL29 family ribosomal protein [Candidatus Absconditabacterales bacterium]|nr:uL29 family ribosomal protein [Candidatus Absconditabacterales bacterium]HNG96744.1 uL29 family ribosomal protein [Candidatus Absconditabacterales bacterium]
MKYTDILTMDSHTLKAELKKAQTQYGELQLKKSIAPGSIKDTSLFKTLRRTIARIQYKLAN